MSWRTEHRRRVMAAEAQATLVMTTALAGILDRIATRFGAITADAQPGEHQANLDDLGAIPAEWRTTVDDDLVPLFREHFHDGARQAVAQVAATTGRPPVEVPVHLVDQGALNYLADARNRFWSLGDDAWGHARDELVAGFDAGEGIDKLRGRLRASVDLATSEAEALARTEVIAASNLGAATSVALMDDGPTHKQWLATNDARTRPTHRHADGQVVPIAQPFEVGHASMAVPGDPAGPAAEVINCRCTVLYLDSAEPVDPDTMGRGQGGVPDVVTAAAGPNGPPQVDTTTGEPHTGAMVALLPDLPDQYVIDGGEPADALHLTLGFLGEATDIPPEVFQQLLLEAEAAAGQMLPLPAQVFGAATWNTTGDSPSMVLSVGGPGLNEAHDLAWTMIQHAARVDAGPDGPGWMPPENHTPWVAHICLAYGDPARMNPAMAAADAEGPIVFDRLRVTSGSDAYDFPLAGQPQEDLPMDRAELSAAITEAVAAGVAAAQAGQGGGPITINLAIGDTPPSGAPSGVGGPVEPQPGEHLHAVMHVRGQSTGEGDTGRVFLNTDYRTPPFSFNWQRSSSAHGGLPETVHVGNVVRVVEDGPALHAFITLDLGGVDGAEYGRRSVAGIERWVSMGLDETRPAKVTVTWPPMDDTMPEAEPGDEEELVTPLRETIDGGRIGELTGVSVPAQADATVEPTPELCQLLGAPAPEGDQALVAAALDATVTGATDLPISDRGHSWDGAGAAGRVFDLYTDAAGNVDTSAVARAFLYRDPEADPATKAAYKLGYADVVNGALQLVPAGLAACAGGRGVDSASIPDGEKATIRSKICTLYGKVQAKYDDWPDCPFDTASAADVAPVVVQAASLDTAGHDCGCGGTCGHCGPPSPADLVQALTAAATTITIPEAPPAAWFQEPVDVPMDAALNIGADGRIWGLLAPKGTGHRAYAASGRRLEVPWGNVDYTRFMGAWAMTDAGKVHAGPLTMDCGHAPMWRPTAEAGREHYDNACSVIGAVAVGESDRLGGVWMAGALLPGVTADQVARALACRCSGDWQPHPDEPGHTELIACLLVPSPGFAQAAAGATTEHRDGVLVASSVPVHWSPPADAPAARKPQRYAEVVAMVADGTTGSPAQRVLGLTTK